jgi:hypothetical protein
MLEIVGIAPSLLTSTLDRGELLASRPGRFTSWKRTTDSHFIWVWVDLDSVWRLWRREKPLSSAGNCTPAVQHVARHYTDLAMQAHNIFLAYLVYVLCKCDTLSSTAHCNRRGWLAGWMDGWMDGRTDMSVIAAGSLSSPSENRGAHIATLGLVLTGLAGPGMTLSVHCFRGSASKPLAYEY